MDKKKSQHYNFCYDVIPALFHSQTDEFMKYVQRDGLKFIQFWWDHVGSRLPAEQQTPFNGTQIEIVERTAAKRIVFIQLPPPRNEGEMYFLGLVRDPERHFAWVRLPSTRILGLVRRVKENFPNGTELGDLTPRALYVPVGPGPAANYEDFKRVVFEMTKPRGRA